MKNLLEGGFIEWDFKAEFYTHLMRQRYKTDLQLSFRTRQHNGQLFKLQNVQKSEYMVLEVSVKVVDKYHWNSMDFQYLIEWLLPLTNQYLL